MRIKNILIGILLVGMGGFYCACNVEYTEYETPVVQPGGDGDAGDDDTGDEGELPPLDLSKDYTIAPIGTAPSVVTLSQTVSTVNGQPFVPLALYGVNEKDMPMVKSWGFNMVHSYQLRDENRDEDDWLAYMDAAQANGLMVFFNLDGATLTTAKEEKIKRQVQCVKNHPALYAWYLADEPYIKSISPATLKKMYDWIKKEDPNHPVISSNWELGNFKDCCDLDMRQLYDGVPFKLTPDLTSYLKGNAKYNKPWLAILNAYDSGWGSNVKKSVNPTSTFSKLAEAGYKDGDPEWEAEEALWLPFVADLEHPEAHGFTVSAAFPNTAEEIRGSFYWAFLHGSNGLYYWLYAEPSTLNLRWGWYTVFHQSRLREAISKTIGELGKISKYLVDPSKNSITFFDETYPGIYVWSKIVDKRRIVIILNETGTIFNSPVDLSRLYISSRKLRVYNEDNRVIELDKNEFIDSFKKDEVHVYFVE